MPEENIQTQENQTQENTQDVQQPEVQQPTELEVLKQQLDAKNQEIQQKDRALYQQNVQLQTYQRLFQENKDRGMSNQEAKSEAIQTMKDSGDSVEFLHTGNAINLFNKILDERESKQYQARQQQATTEYVNQTVAKEVENLLSSKFKFRANYSDSEKQAILNDRIPHVQHKVWQGYPTIEAALKDSFVGLIEENIPGFTTHNTQTQGMTDTSSQVSGAPGHAPDLVKKQELERATDQLRKREISYRDWLGKYRAVHGDSHIEVHNPYSKH
jgi:hypothetical protein